MTQQGETEFRRRREDMKSLAQLEAEARENRRMRVAFALGGALAFCVVIWYGIIQLIKRFF